MIITGRCPCLPDRQAEAEIFLFQHARQRLERCSSQGGWRRAQNQSLRHPPSAILHPNNRTASDGFTLTELLVSIVIAGIFMFAFTVPFLAERIFWQHGKQQTEAQRDAQLVFHTISLAARACRNATVTTAAGDTTVTLDCPCSTTPETWASVIFRGGPGFNSGQLLKTDQRVSPATAVTLIDGTKSKVTQFTAEDFSATKPLLHLTLGVDHKDSGSELLETRILLRNVS